MIGNTVCNAVTQRVTYCVVNARPEPEPEPEPGSSCSYVCLWLLVVETLILNIISQRARAMMTQ